MGLSGMVRRSGFGVRGRIPGRVGILAASVLVGAACSAPTADDVLSARATTGGATAFGRLVDVGHGRTMYLECQGSGSPTVVLVPGLVAAADTWSYVTGAAERGSPAVLPCIPEWGSSPGSVPTIVRGRRGRTGSSPRRRRWPSPPRPAGMPRTCTRCWKRRRCPVPMCSRDGPRAGPLPGSMPVSTRMTWPVLFSWTPSRNSCSRGSRRGSSPFFWRRSETTTRSVWRSGRMSKGRIPLPSSSKCVPLRRCRGFRWWCCPGMNSMPMRFVLGCRLMPRRISRRCSGGRNVARSRISRRSFPVHSTSPRPVVTTTSITIGRSW